MCIYISFPFSAGFMQKNVITLWALPIAVLVSVSCSNFDQYTSVGAEVVKKSDPSLTDFDDNFYPVDFGTDLFIEMRSIPDLYSDNFGYHFGSLAAGTRDSVYIYGTTEFYLSPSFTEDLDPSDVLDSITFAFDTLMDTLRETTVGASDIFTAYPCTEENRYSLTPPDSSDTALCTLAPTEDGSTFTGKISNEAFADSVFAQCISYKKCTDKADGNDNEKQKYCDSTINAGFFIALFNQGKHLVWFQSSPAMVIHSHRDTSDTVIARTDTLFGIPGLVAKESEEMRSGNAVRPITSNLAKRTTVFKLDLTDFWDTLDASGFSEILSAAVTFVGEPPRITGNDSTPSVQYFLSDKLFSDGSELDEHFDTIQSIYRSSATLESEACILKCDTCTTSDCDSTKGGTCFVFQRCDTIVFPVDQHLQHFTENRKKIFYFYLRIIPEAIASNQEILWYTPRFKAVFTSIN